MQKYTALVFGLIVVGVVALIVSERPHRGGATTTEVRDAGAGADAGVPGAGGPLADAGGSEDSTASPESPFATDAGTTLINGSAPPPLPADAPKSVVFG